MISKMEITTVSFLFDMTCTDHYRFVCPNYDLLWESTTTICSTNDDINWRNNFVSALLEQPRR